jgi:hypothetical protein
LVPGRFPGAELHGRLDYFLVVGHMQCVGILLPMQTLPWQISIFSVAFTVPAVSFGDFILIAFFPSISLLFLLLV